MKPNAFGTSPFPKWKEISIYSNKFAVLVPERDWHITIELFLPKIKEKSIYLYKLCESLFNRNYAAISLKYLPMETPKVMALKFSDRIKLLEC